MIYVWNPSLILQLDKQYIYIYMCVCVCVCGRVRVRVFKKN